MGYIRMDLAEMSRFFAQTEEICDSFCDSQAAIERAFDRAVDTWRDRNAVTTGARLYETARDIARFYGSLGAAVEYVARVCNNRAELVDREGFTQPRFEIFKICITEVDMDEAVINTDPDALDEFKTALDVYIQSIADNVERLNRLYDRIGESWDDEQYVRFGDALREFVAAMQTQVDTLDRISLFLKSKIEIMRRADI